MNTKGFTLIELLAVIVILSLLALLTSTAVTKLVSDAKEDLSDTQIQLIKSAAEVWGADNLMELPSAGECSYITLEDLKKYGLMDSNVLDPKTSQAISDDLKIKITTTLSGYGNPTTTYEVNPETVDGCSKVYFCTPSEKQYFATSPTEPGYKYECKVDPNKDPYTFYVLNSTESSVNLIMDSNINISGEPVKSSNMEDKGFVAWLSKADYMKPEIGGTEEEWAPGNWDKGPITAMDYLQTATSGWSNVNELKINTFTACDNSTTCIEKEMIEYVVNARLPYFDEISSYDSTTGSYAYLYDNLDTSCYDYSPTSCDIAGKEGLGHVSSVLSYWTLSSDISSATDAFKVSWMGLVNTEYVFENSVFGVRPVINIPINKIG